jgi:hypothetical protein
MTDTTLMTADTPTDEAASQTAGDVANNDATAQQPAAEAAPTDPVEGEQAQQTEGDKAEDAPQGAPEAYEDFSVPEGVELDAEVLGEFKAVAKELNLPQDAAQKVTDLGVKLAQKWEAERQQATSEMFADWKGRAETDKEFGGDALPANLAVAKKAVDQFGTPELRELLDVHRLGDNPEVIRFMFRVGKAISEDTFVAGGKSSPAQDAAKTLFPNMN